MKERPILFTTEMVRAYLAGKKTQTRRVIKPQPFGWAEHIEPYPCDKLPGYGQPGDWLQASEYYHKACGLGCKCPYGNPGDVLWWRETWASHSMMSGIKPSELPKVGPFFYRADPEINESHYWWRPSIFMPRWASRIQTPIVSVRVERVQEITEKDARTEGVPGIATHEPYPRQYRDSFEVLWNVINAKRGYSWESNPWVWVIEFSRLQS
jgi:hypothetical protein